MEQINFTDFEKLEMKVGVILACEKHPDADKLLVFTLDFNEGSTRTIVSSLADFYESSELVGKKIIALLNLKPRKLRGIESQGMILTTELIEGNKEYVEVITSDMPKGSIVC